MFPRLAKLDIGLGWFHSAQARCRYPQGMEPPAPLAGPPNNHFGMGDDLPRHIHGSWLHRVQRQPQDLADTSGHSDGLSCADRYRSQFCSTLHACSETAHWLSLGGEEPYRVTDERQRRSNDVDKAGMAPGYQSSGQRSTRAAANFYVLSD